MNNDYQKYHIFRKFIYMSWNLIRGIYSGYIHLFYVQTVFLSHLYYVLQLWKHNHFWNFLRFFGQMTLIFSKVWTFLKTFYMPFFWKFLDSMYFKTRCKEMDDIPGFNPYLPFLLLHTHDESEFCDHRLIFFSRPITTGMRIATC